MYLITYFLFFLDYILFYNIVVIIYSSLIRNRNQFVTQLFKIRTSTTSGKLNHHQSGLNYTSRDATDPFTYKQRFFMNRHYSSLKTNLDKVFVAKIL